MCLHLIFVMRLDVGTVAGIFVISGHNLLQLHGWLCDEVSELQCCEKAFAPILISSVRVYISY